MPKISLSKLYSLLDKSNSFGCKHCKGQHYIAWSDFPEQDDEFFVSCGELDTDKGILKKNGFKEYPTTDSTYWKKDYPLAIQYYPCNSSSVLHCKECDAVFLTYMEIGGFKPQKRIRFVKRELIVDKE